MNNPSQNAGCVDEKDSHSPLTPSCAVFVRDVTRGRFELLLGVALFSQREPLGWDGGLCRGQPLAVAHCAARGEGVADPAGSQWSTAIWRILHILYLTKVRYSSHK
ncbi:hypothetical protein PH5382_03919 [Phaeobacter sp. CECT 5382]|nr:hypothetical protein PH5382_03919 [Phaeobacter sp. CECT 5382]